MPQGLPSRESPARFLRRHSHRTGSAFGLAPFFVLPMPVRLSIFAGPTRHCPALRRLRGSGAERHHAAQAECDGDHRCRSRPGVRWRAGIDGSGWGSVADRGSPRITVSISRQASGIAPCAVPSDHVGHLPPTSAISAKATFDRSDRLIICFAVPNVLGPVMPQRVQNQRTPSTVSPCRTPVWGTHQAGACQHAPGGGSCGGRVCSAL